MGQAQHVGAERTLTDCSAGNSDGTFVKPMQRSKLNPEVK